MELTFKIASRQLWGGCGGASRLPPARRPRESMEREAHTRNVERVIHRRKQLQRPRDILTRKTTVISRMASLSQTRLATELPESNWTGVKTHLKQKK